ncbi:MAG: glycosyltransferase family 2 protein [Acidobacteriota bacterium]|nr:glycosyltransferase family 2 protein [Acidobacteriota bacterium]
MTHPTVSAVIPAYNAERFIRKAIDSVLAQTVRVAEIIVVDDGSSDGTCAVVESYGGAVRLLRQSNGGPSVARNVGVQAAQSDFVALLDADDAWHAEKIERQLASIAAVPGAVLCYTGILTVDEDGTERYHAPAAPEHLGRLIRVSMPGIPPSCSLVRRSAFLQIGGFNPALKGMEDWDFVLRLLRVGPFCSAAGPMLIYRISSSGVSSDADRILLEVKRMLDPVLLDGLGGLRRWYWRRRILSYQTYKAGLTARATRNPRELRYMLESIVLWPSLLWHPVRFKAAAWTLGSVLRRRMEGTRAGSASLR